jgi:hypothetical protein
MSADFLATEVKQFEDTTTKFRDFTCRVSSIEAAVKFLKVEDFINAIRLLSTDLLKTIYM